MRGGGALPPVAQCFGGGRGGAERAEPPDSPCADGSARRPLRGRRRRRSRKRTQPDGASQRGARHGSPRSSERRGRGAGSPRGSGGSGVSAAAVMMNRFRKWLYKPKASCEESPLPGAAARGHRHPAGEVGTRFPAVPGGSRRAAAGRSAAGRRRVGRAEPRALARVPADAVGARQRERLRRRGARRSLRRGMTKQRGSRGAAPTRGSAARGGLGAPRSPRRGCGAGGGAQPRQGSAPGCAAGCAEPGPGEMFGRSCCAFNAVCVHLETS